MSGPGELNIELIEDRSAVPLTAEQWNALVARNETNTVFQTYEWFDAWWRTFGDGRRLFLLIVREQGEIVGFAPLMRSRGRFGWREIAFVGSGNADYLDFVLPVQKSRALAAICRFLRAHWHRWERLALSNIPGNSTTLASLNSIAISSNARLHIVQERYVVCPTLALGTDPQHAQKLIRKYSLRRPLNWFSRHGTVKFRHVKSPEEIAKLLPTFYDQHRRRWKALGKRSQFTQALQMRFYGALAFGLAQRGWLQFSVVEFNDEPIAFHFGFDYCDCLTWYKPSFEMRYAEHSPGLLLTRYLIEDGLRRGRREFDFTVGDEPFKNRFATSQRLNVHVGAYHGLVSYGLARVLSGLRRMVGRCHRFVRGLVSDPATVAAGISAISSRSDLL
jgi:CelD/BcsL family acetyltransferase involved in cellulose biosynthesis